MPKFPSPKDHENVSESPSGSELPAALKVTVSPSRTAPEGSMFIWAVGASFRPSVAKQPDRADNERIRAIVVALVVALMAVLPG